jgi:hypothetical protein
MVRGHPLTSWWLGVVHGLYRVTPAGWPTDGQLPLTCSLWPVRFRNHGREARVDDATLRGRLGASLLRRHGRGDRDVDLA